MGDGVKKGKNSHLGGKAGIPISQVKICKGNS